jgi:hypothetical protein
MARTRLSNSLLRLFNLLLICLLSSVLLETVVAAPIHAVSAPHFLKRSSLSIYQRDITSAETELLELTTPPPNKPAPAKPQPGPSKPPAKPAPPPTPPPVYPNLRECENAINLGGKTVVFYSNADPGDAAYKFSVSPGINGVILNNALPKGFMKKRSGPDDGNRLYNQFLNDASKALALKSSGSVYFVTSKEGPKEDKIWKQVEEPALHANLAVKRIIKVDSGDFSKRDNDFWVRH